MSSVLPAVNASLNAGSGVLLCSAFVFIKMGRWRAHACSMIGACVVSAAFLTCYLIYHFRYPAKSTAAHPGLLRDVYLLVLVPHVLLAMLMLPMIFVTLRRAYRRDWVSHKRISLPTFWVWLYVSVTGVVVYFMLYHSRLT